MALQLLLLLLLSPCPSLINDWTSIPGLPSLLHLIPYFSPPFPSISIFFLTQTADLNVQNKLCWIMDEGSCIIYGATGWGSSSVCSSSASCPLCHPLPFPWANWGGDGTRFAGGCSSDPTFNQRRDLISQDYAPRGVVTMGDERCWRSAHQRLSLPAGAEIMGLISHSLMFPSCLSAAGWCCWKRLYNQVESGFLPFGVLFCPECKYMRKSAVGWRDSFWQAEAISSDFYIIFRISLHKDIRYNYNMLKWSTSTLSKITFW